MLQSNRSFQVLNNMTNLKSGLSPLIECPCRFETKIWRIISFLQRSDQEDQRIVFLHSHNWKVLFSHHLDHHPHHDHHHNQLFCDDWNPGGMCSEHWGRRCKGELLIISVSTYSATRGLGMLVGNQDLSVHPYFFVSTLNHCFDHDDHKAWQIRPLGVEIIASDKCQPPPRLHDVPGERWLPSHL